MILNYHFGQRLKEYLEENNIKPTAFAKSIGIHSQAIYKLYDTEHPRKATVDTILSVLNLTLEEFFNPSKKVSEPPVEYKVKKSDTIELKIEDYNYLMNALRERDELKNKEIERLKETNRATQPETH